MFFSCYVVVFNCFFGGDFCLEGGLTGATTEQACRIEVLQEVGSVPSIRTLITLRTITGFTFWYAMNLVVLSHPQKGV